jgi:flagellar biosynthesis protein FlhB
VSQNQGTHKPTPKRVREFRKRGDIAMSRDVTAIAALVGGALGTTLCAGRAGAALTDFTRASAATAAGGAAPQAGDATHAFLVAALPALVGAVLGAIVAGLAQLGWPPALRRPSFDLSRVFSGGSLKEAWSPKAAARRAGVAAAKIAAVGAVVFAIVKSEIARGFAATTPGEIAGRISGAVVRLSIAAAVALALLAAADYLLARRRIDAKMKMTPDEIRRELREQEGDPQVKGKRRRRMREIAKRRMVSEVKAADVVVVNPTHYAVALRYDSSKDGAPRVVAKGTDEVAERIREIARQAGVPIVARPPLARALYKVPEGREVPGPLFKAVAEVLAYVYRLRRRHLGGSR